MKDVHLTFRGVVEATTVVHVCQRGRVRHATKYGNWAEKPHAKLTLLAAAAAGLPVLFLPTGQKSAFSTRRGDSLHQSSEIWHGWVRVAMQNFAPIGARGRNTGTRLPKIWKFQLYVVAPRGEPLDRFLQYCCWGLLYAQLSYKFDMMSSLIWFASHVSLRSYCWETAW